MAWHSLKPWINRSVHITFGNGGFIKGKLIEEDIDKGYLIIERDDDNKPVFVFTHSVQFVQLTEDVPFARPVAAASPRT